MFQIQNCSLCLSTIMLLMMVALLLLVVPLPTAAATFVHHTTTTNNTKGPFSFLTVQNLWQNDTSFLHSNAVVLVIDGSTSNVRGNNRRMLFLCM